MSPILHLELTLQRAANEVAVSYALLMHAYSPRKVRVVIRPLSVNLRMNSTRPVTVIRSNQHKMFYRARLYFYQQGQVRHQKINARAGKVEGNGSLSQG